MNRFNLIIVVLVFIIVSSVGATVVYLHEKQAQEAIAQNLSEISPKQDQISNQEYNNNLDSNLPQTLQPASKSIPTKPGTDKNTISPKTNVAAFTTLSVASHSSKSNCWIIISNKVYNVTNFLNTHPGGVSAITPYCGQDATNAFNSNSVGHNHSSYARSLLPTYFVGDIVTQNLPTPTPTTNTSPIPTPTTSSTPTQGGVPASYTVNVTSNGTISPSSLTINTGDTVVFTYISSGGEAYLTFSPSLGGTIKLDSEFRTKSHTFNSTGTWSYHRQDGTVTNATIIVQ